MHEAERDLGIAKSSIHRILKIHNFHPYSYQLVQNLRLTDFARRTEFCEFLLTKYTEDESFLKNIIWTDEAKFNKNGIFNRHNSHYNGEIVNQCLYNLFDDRWISNNGPHRWPPRSPDLTPLDFFIWGYVKDLVYSTPLTTKENCQERVRNAFRSLTRDQIQSATNREIISRVTKCLEVNGNYFEHVLHV